MEPILVAAQIDKQFPGVLALDKVDFDLVPGEVHALVGENGAGKSTLIKIFGGLLQATSGTIHLNGQLVRFDNPQQSQSAGISVITQEFNLVPQLTVGENIFLGREPVRPGGLLDRDAIRTRAGRILEDLGLDVPADQRVEYLGIGDKQLVEIAKALSQEFRIFIMDEPTAALNAAEVERLFAIVDNLRRRGIAILYVSHRLNEIFRLADRVTVLRDGKCVGTRAIKDVTMDDVITLMLGRELGAGYLQKPEVVASVDGEEQTPALSVRDVCVPGTVSGVSFDLHYGEVLGCAGLIGSGRSGLMRALFGLIPFSGGQMLVNGEETVLSDPAAALRKGIFMLPEDRKVEGIFPYLTLLENLVITSPRLGNLLSRLVLHQKAEQTQYAQIRNTLDVRASSSSQLITALSGGNQQKVMLGRALSSQSRILLLNEPTRGVDVGTKVEIHQLIRQLARENMAVLVSSSDVPELVHVCDRCLILHAGRTAGMLVGEQITEDNIVAAAVVGQTAREEAK